MEQTNREHKIDRETVAFMLFLCGMAVYYGWRMFKMTPWYDELYTYYYFISRGPVYAAIHWPLPNNHIGYSVLSACLGIFGNASVALRGISYLSSLGSLMLLYSISRKCFDRGMALMPVLFFTGMKIVNQLAVQGRGYAFVTFCYLAAICELFRIVVEHRERIGDYLVFGICLTAALYAIPSSVYVVVPVCLSGGVLLLVQGEYRRLIRLVLVSLTSALCTLGLYGTVWLAIGSNLLTKEQGSAHYGQGHVTVILRAPFAALKRGIEYMLATPYIQSVGRDGFLGKFGSWLKSMLNEYYAGWAIVLAVMLVFCLIGVLCRIAKKNHNGSYRTHVIDQEKDAKDFLEIYLAVSMVVLPLMLLIQCSLPYYRVFSFAGVLVSLALAWLWQEAAGCLAGKTGKKKVTEGETAGTGIKKDGTGQTGFEEKKASVKRMGIFGSTALGIVCIIMLASPSYRAQYSDREAAIEDAYRQVDLAQAGKIGITDCDQEYLLLFLYDIGEDRVTMDLSQADMVLADKFLLLGDLNEQSEAGYWSSDEWKLYMTAEEFKESGATEEMERIYENDRFVLYSRIQDVRK